MLQKQKKVPERVGAEDGGYSGYALSGHKVKNLVTVT